MAYDPSLFEAQRRAATGAYASQSAANEYARFLAQQRGSRNLAAFERQTVGQIPQFSRGFGRRGLYGQGVRSGLFNRALSSFGEEAARQRRYLEQDIAQGQQEFGLREAQYRSGLEQQLADIESQKARQIAETAAGLLNL
jgi:hypothetical protein